MVLVNSIINSSRSPGDLNLNFMLFNNFSLLIIWRAHYMVKSSIKLQYGNQYCWRKCTLRILMGIARVNPPHELVSARFGASWARANLFKKVVTLPTLPTVLGEPNRLVTHMENSNCAQPTTCKRSELSKRVARPVWQSLSFLITSLLTSHKKNTLAIIIFARSMFHKSRW